MRKLNRNDICWCGINEKYKKCCWPEKDPENNIITNPVGNNNCGTQPIKVLFQNIIKSFEKTHKNFVSELEIDTSEKDLKKGIKIFNSETKIDEVAYINSNKQIHIQETFLSYIWIFSYCIVDIFDNHIQILRIKNGGKSDNVELEKTFDFFKYGLSLIDRFTDWDIDKYPNPYKYPKEQKVKIEKINSVFLHATNWILCHEYSHFSLGHTDQTIHTLTQGGEIEANENRTNEIEADKNSINLMLKEWKSKRIKKNVEYGIISGISSLLFFDSITKKKNYPDPEIRLKSALNQMNISPKDLHWGLASLALKLWTDRQGAKLNLPPIMDNYKDVFDKIIQEIETIKNS